jgi:hypothetical protein
MSESTVPAVLALAALVLLGATAGPVAASSQPSPVCPVCNSYVWMGDDTDWSSPDHRTLTVKAHENGSATWVADFRWNDSGNAPAPEDESRLQARAEEALETSHPEAKSVTVGLREDGEATIRWRRAGVVDERLGHGVFRLFHSEGGELRRFVNVDRLVIQAPDGQVVTNDPAVGSVTDDGTAVSVDGPEREVGDFYVVFGEERDAAASVTTTLAIGSLVWPVAAQNLLLNLLFPAIVFGFGLTGLYALGRSRGVDPERANRYGVAGLVAGVVTVGAYVRGPGPLNPPYFLPATLVAFGALAAFGAAVAIGGRRQLVGTALAVPAIALAPFVAWMWPAVRVPGLGLLASMLQAGLAVAILVLGVPCFLYGMALGERRTPA